jgi:hypothetical protein
MLLVLPYMGSTVAHRHGARFAGDLRRSALARGHLAHTRAARARARGRKVAVW